MNIFSNLAVYAGKWSLSDARNFTEEEISAVDTAEVVSSKYGNSVCFHMKSGGMTFIPLSSESILTVGENVDLAKAELLTLSKQGEKDICRVRA